MLRVPQTHLEVLGIHVQLVTVKLTELSKGALEVVQVFQAITKGVQHLLAMGLHFSIAHNSIRSGQVPKGVKEPLSPGVDNQQSDAPWCLFVVASEHGCFRSKCKQQLSLFFLLCPALILHPCCYEIGPGLGVVTQGEAYPWQF
uniref:Uncharacterized protein n=1 Tax=Canis lupus familiaris TaxID=9615 RepID=A0A8C0RMR3_CANLF